ncbi:MAG: polyprenyl diphosphate synthase [Pseudomonadota bacterium]|nr:polyprenyl diphosphate synthase [Pseudomonadota bacterium]
MKVKVKIEIPNHVAVIMDGNGRWANKRNLRRTEGHLKGLDRVKDLIEHSVEVGVEFLTLFAFSSENWRRPETEVRYLLELFVKALEEESLNLANNGVRLAFIGDLEGFPTGLRKKMKAVEDHFRGEHKLLLNVAANYGGRWDVVQAAKKVCESVAEGLIRPEQVDGEVLAENMCLANIPEPDLLIRTGGEKRLSNYLLWQLAYTELYFTEKYWPDFDIRAFEEALVAYSKRERRFGMTQAQLRSKELTAVSF